MTDTEKAAFERRIDELCAKNERLRKTATMLASARTDLLAKNAKLRELCVQMVETVECSSSAKRCVLFSECAAGGYEPCLYEQKLRELGIEVN